MCLPGSVMGSGLPLLPGSLLPWRYSFVPLVAPLLRSPDRPSPFHSSSLCAPLPFPGCLSPSLIAMQSVAEKSVTLW